MNYNRQRIILQLNDGDEDEWFNDGTTYGSDGSEHK